MSYARTAENFSSVCCNFTEDITILLHTSSYVTTSLYIQRRSAIVLYNVQSFICLKEHKKLQVLRGLVSAIQR